jgi:hypothetical protein
MGDGIIFVPWYEADDYHQFRRMNGGTGLAPTYEEWLRAAIQEVTHLLAAGNAIQIVRLRPDTYFEWLATRCAPDTSKERLAYLSDMTARSGCVDRHGTLACSRRQAHTHH